MDTRFPILVDVQHMLRTYHSSYEHPVISPLKLSVRWFSELFVIALQSVLIDIWLSEASRYMALRELLDMVLCELPDYGSFELPVI
ncbi:hypothetical protein J1N35_018737 [Gossypium stocksii]|uniref:Uncharacterized protein n=1 Tax=Gossypium stocksii TaxID=47602 RepID=A0A9D4A7D4_9ROSI|nr:hypothetical protein J1N35_018737 [Gossypium stocksii]